MSVWEVVEGGCPFVLPFWNRELYAHSVGICDIHGTGSGCPLRHCPHGIARAVSSGILQNVTRPPVLGVVNAASAVSARTLTCRAPAVPRSCSMLSVYIAVRQRPVPRLPPLEQNGCGLSTLISPA